MLRLRLTGSTASAGGNGGGIVIIVADSIDGNNHFIRSNGVTAAQCSFRCRSRRRWCRRFSSSLIPGIQQSAPDSNNGGNGGTNPGGFGEGGGGGGGLIWLSTSSMPASVTSASVAYGTPAPTIASEGTGEIKVQLFPKA